MHRNSYYSDHQTQNRVNKKGAHADQDMSPNCAGLLVDDVARGISDAEQADFEHPRVSELAEGNVCQLMNDDSWKGCQRDEETGNKHETCSKDLTRTRSATPSPPWRVNCSKVNGNHNEM